MISEHIHIHIYIYTYTHTHTHTHTNIFYLVAIRGQTADESITCPGVQNQGIARHC